MEIIIECIQADVPNKNGRIYTTECLEKAVNSVNALIEQKMMFLIAKDNDRWQDNGSGIHLQDIGGIVNKCELKEGFLTIDVNIEKFPTSKSIKALLESKNYHIQPNMIGSIQNNVVTIDSINAFAISMKEPNENRN